MEKKKFDFKKFSLVLCICFVTLFAFIPFANFTNFDSVNAETVSTSIYVSDDNLLSSSTDTELTSVIGKKWYGLDSFMLSSRIWLFFGNYYYSDGTKQYVLDKETSTWNSMSWSVLNDFSGSNIWTDGNNIYCSNGTVQYVLGDGNVLTKWKIKNWHGLTSFYATNIWTDGVNIYYSSGSKHYVLDKPSSTWNTISWNGLANPNVNCIWTDGVNVYHSSDSSTTHYVLDKETFTWNTITWNGLSTFAGQDVWTDGNNIYYSNSTSQYVLDKETSTWNKKSWDGAYSCFNGRFIWTDGVNIYANHTTYSLQITCYTEYELGLNDGYNNGYEQGYDDGISKDYTTGYNDGKEDGYVVGNTVGLNEGINIGYNYGYDEGYDDGNVDGYANGKTEGLNEGYNNGYEQGKNDGFAEAENNYYSYGPFSYSTISYYVATSSGINIDRPLNELYNGYFTSYDCVTGYNGGFYLYDPDVEAYMIDNEDLQVGLRIVFDSPISCLRYAHLVPLRLGFGNIITLSFTDGTKTSFNMADGYYDYIDLSDYSSKYILSLDVIILRLDFLDIGLAFSNDYVHIYDLAYRDGRDDGYSTGYSEGATIGYNNGYNNGLNDSNQYTFYNLFGAVLDAPVKVFSSLFNFNFLGVNLLGLITGLFTLAMILLVIKLILGGK